jgi:alkanesulfonate monooxygenase SsuD/methylene tetrahydromethanopterin reductase-like flavin-dependent oxidoreductase (luciferase family)
VPFGSRGDLLDEQLAAWRVLWRDTPATFSGAHHSFSEVYFEPKSFRKSGPTLWLGGAGMHRRMTERIVRYGDDFNPLGVPGAAEMQRLRAAMAAAGRDVADLELVGGTRATFPDGHSTADLGQALAASRRSSRRASRRSASSRRNSLMIPVTWPGYAQTSSAGSIGWRSDEPPRGESIRRSRRSRRPPRRSGARHPPRPRSGDCG